MSGSERSSKSFGERPWLSALVMMLALVISFFANIPILGDVWLIFLLVVTAAIFFFYSEALFKAIFIVFVLLTISVTIYMFLNFLNNFAEEDKIEAVTRIVKAVSLFTILIEGMKGAFFAERLAGADQKGWKGATLAGAFACIICALILIISVFPRTDAVLTPFLPGGEELRPLWMTMAVNFIAIIPILIFLFANFRVVKSKTIDRKSYIFGICNDYLCYVNMPGVMGSIFLFLFALVLHSIAIPTLQIKILISGGMTFLIFSAVLVSHVIEHRNQESESEGEFPTPKAPPGVPPNAQFADGQLT